MHTLSLLAAQSRKNAQPFACLGSPVQIAFLALHRLSDPSQMAFWFSPSFSIEGGTRHATTSSCSRIRQGICLYFIHTSLWCILTRPSPVHPYVPHHVPTVVWAAGIEIPDNGVLEGGNDRIHAFDIGDANDDLHPYAKKPARTIVFLPPRHHLSSMAVPPISRPTYITLSLYASMVARPVRGQSISMVCFRLIAARQAVVALIDLLM